MKQCKVLTFCTWTSIGSILQSYGLKKALEQLECKSTILLPARTNDFFVGKVHSVKSFISFVFQMFIHNHRIAAHHKRLSYIEKALDLQYYGDYAELVALDKNEEECVYIAGSDQIWNPDQCRKSFFLDFVRNHRCISYGASMGKTEIHPDKQEVIKGYLSKFDHISVREEQCRESLQPLTGKDISVHIDPTFLITNSDWRSQEKPYGIQGSYILVYMIYWNKTCKEQIKELKRRTGLPVYAVCSGLSRVYADHYLFDVGVEEFLWLVDHAEYVVTSSFHGAAMSAIFNKRFSAVINPATPSRIQNLMDKLKIPRVPIECLPDQEFDYTTICARMELERLRGLHYLNEAVNE